jgi:hydrogenase maturation protease
MTMLVAGIGNVFLGDDGFGVEVARSLENAQLPDSVDVADYGIRGVHLAYELLDGRYDTLVLVDAVPLGESPGTVALLDATDRADRSDLREAGPVDAHSMSPDVVLRSLSHLGGHVDRVLVVGCQPAVVEERMGLSESVAGAVEVAHDMVLDLAFAEAAALATAPPRRERRRGRDRPVEARLQGRPQT